MSDNCWRPQVKDGSSCPECTADIPNVIRERNAAEKTWSAMPEDDKARKALPILTFLTEYFPDVIIELTKLCVAGNIQHNPELAPSDIKWAREKSRDQLNTAFRHMWDRAIGVHYDTDGQSHLVKAIWRNMAQRQLDIEAERAHEGP